MEYYLEFESDRDRMVIKARGDDEALEVMHRTCHNLNEVPLVLYKESDTEEGLPFIILYESAQRRLSRAEVSKQSGF